MARQESSYLHVSNNWRGYRIISCSLHSGNLCFLFVLFLSVSFRVEQISRTTPQILQMAVAAVVVAAAVVAVDAAVIVVVATAAVVEAV